jgi:2-dehydro-3-deoxyphosphogluconate aldolase/(4S)-4-hydroxy-2-oxoglutarate aldolase
MKKDIIRAGLQSAGIVPSIRTPSADDARFAADVLYESGIGVVEIAWDVPGALEMIADLTRRSPDLIVGADSVWDLAGAMRAVDAGARFLTSPALDLDALSAIGSGGDVIVIPGALTPTEVSAAWRAGADFVKVFPCARLGGPRYIRALRAPFPQIPLIASGGVTQLTAEGFIRAGAAAIGVGTELIPARALRERDRRWITELAHRFQRIVEDARGQPDAGDGERG